MSLTILSVAYPLAPVSEDAVGGAEQVLAMLDRALVQAGHRSFVIASGESRVCGTLLPLPAVPAQIDEAARATAQLAVRAAIAHALAAHAIDLIHFHGLDFLDYLPAPGVPVLATLHLPLSWYPAELFTRARPDLQMHCVSRAQHQSAPAHARLLPPVQNGVDLASFHPRGRKRNFAMMLGRICPEKGVDVALRACRAANVPLLIGGRVYAYAAHQTYFRDCVEPLLGRDRRFLGELALARKSRLLAAARCLLIPSLAPETSSLVAMESIASGTPVIAFRSGALPEVVEDGVTGFLCDDENEMAQAIGRIGALDPHRCREEAVKRFSSAAAIRAYFEMYRQLRASYSIHS